MLAEHASLTRKAFKLRSTPKVAWAWSKRSAVNKNAPIFALVQAALADGLPARPSRTGVERQESTSVCHWFGITTARFVYAIRGCLGSSTKPSGAPGWGLEVTELRAAATARGGQDLAARAARDVAEASLVAGRPRCDVVLDRDLEGAERAGAPAVPRETSRRATRPMCR
jgi:hypothetical protein